jgi:nucleotide-binding universal stress UspA family protein
MSRPILVGYDGTDVSSRALDQAIENARATTAPLIVLVVAPMPLDPVAPNELPSWMMGPPDPEQEALRTIVAEGKTPPALEPLVRDAEQRVGTSGVTGEVMWRLGDPVQEILDLARDQNAATIVLGAHHHHRLGGLFDEDVAAGVQRHAGCDVVSVD